MQSPLTSTLIKVLYGNLASDGHTKHMETAPVVKKIHVKTIAAYQVSGKSQSSSDSLSKQQWRLPILCCSTMRHQYQVHAGQICKHDDKKQLYFLYLYKGIIFEIKFWLIIKNNIPIQQLCIYYNTKLTTPGIYETLYK